MDSQNLQPQPSNQPVQIPQEIRSFLEGLLNDANMTTLDNEMKEEMISELYARLDTYISSALIEKLLPEDMETFIKMNEEGKSKDEVEKFLQEKIPNSKEVFAQVFSNFRDLYLGNVSVARNAPT